MIRRNEFDSLVRLAVLSVVILLAAAVVLPYLYVLSISVRPPTELFEYSVELVPDDPTLENWYEGVSDMAGPLINSVIVGAGTAVVSLFISVPSAYALGRTRFSHRREFLYLVGTALLFPYFLLAIPISVLWRDLGLFNTVPGLILAYQVYVTPFGTWILQSFFERLPRNLEDTARVYGLTRARAFVQVVLPLAFPGVVAVGFLAFLVAWNDLLFANLLTTSRGPRPAVVVLFETVTRSSSGERTLWLLLAAESLIVGFPPAIMYMVTRRYLARSFRV